MASKQELDEIMAELRALPPATIKPYRHSRLEHVAAWCTSKIIHNVDAVGSRLVLYLAQKGGLFLENQKRKLAVVERRPVHIDGDEFMREYEALRADIRRTIGYIDSTNFIAVMSNMMNFCFEFSEYGNRNMMMLRLPYNAALHIAAYFFRPVFYWDLLRSLFADF